MAGHTCYHCKQWVGDGEAHDCWTTTEAALTQELSEDLKDAWIRLRETVSDFGDQRIYASHHSIMFSRKSCYFFVRPKKSFLEVVFFLGRSVRAPQIRRADRTSATKIAHVLRLTHRDEVESPITDWLMEAYAHGEGKDTTGGKHTKERTTKGAKRTKPTNRAKPAKAKQSAAKRARRGHAQGRT